MFSLLRFSKEEWKLALSDSAALAVICQQPSRKIIYSLNWGPKKKSNTGTSNFKCRQSNLGGRTMN
jgi:membrane carboxypeptidase/penicillin-binding protein PbpC